MNRKTLTLTALVVTAGLTVAACGGGSDWESDVRTYAMAGETDESIAETCEAFAMLGLETEADAVDMVLAMASTDADTPIAEVSDVLEFTDENGDVVDISYPSSVTAGEVATVTANELLKHCDLEQAAADVQAELEESFTEAIGPMAYGDDAYFDGLQDAALAGDVDAANELREAAPFGSEYEVAAAEALAALETAMAYGDHPHLDALYDAALGGDEAAADELFQLAPYESQYLADVADHYGWSY